MASPTRHCSDTMAHPLRDISVALADQYGSAQCQASRPQLPPIHSAATAILAREHQDDRLSVCLAPLKIPPGRGEQLPPRRTTPQAIPVAHLLVDETETPSTSLCRTFAAPINPAKLLFNYRSDSSHRFSNPPTYYPSVPRPIPASAAASPTQGPQYTPSCPPAPYTTEPCFSTRDLLPLPPPSRDRTSHNLSPDTTTYPSPSYTISETSRRSSIGSRDRSDHAEPRSCHHGSPSHPASFPPPPPALSSRRPPPPPPLRYNLTIRQQPRAARACGYGERDRRVVDPPPILDLKITDIETDSPASDPKAMLALHCELLNVDGPDDESENTAANAGFHSAHRLTGTSVASPYHAKDEHGKAGSFFVFHDLSCRSPGKYRLKFRLVRVDSTNMAAGGRSVASIETDVFRVYTAKDFPGMQASSKLLKALRAHGFTVGVKKGSEVRKKEESSEEEDEDEAGDDDDKGEAQTERERNTTKRDGNEKRSPAKVQSPKLKGRKKSKRMRREK